jgi:hypothetical protein
MAIRFIETDPETGEGYNIDDDTGDVYDADGNQLDPSTATVQVEPQWQRDNDGESNVYDTGDNTYTPITGNSGFDWNQIAKQFGIQDKDGQYDLKKILALTGGALGVVGAATTPEQKQKSVGELRAGMPTQSAMNSSGWTPEQLAFGQRPMQTGSALQRVYAADMQSPITPGKTSRQYAEGGEVEGALSQAFAGAVQGDDGGQSDLIDAKLSPGEYVMDAESVSALGDGNTAAGIAKLDELRAKLREQKRSAPTSDIPPPAQGPLSYIGGAQ